MKDGEKVIYEHGSSAWFDYIVTKLELRPPCIDDGRSLSWPIMRLIGAYHWARPIVKQSTTDEGSIQQYFSVFVHSIERGLTKTGAKSTAKKNKIARANIIARALLQIRVKAYRTRAFITGDHQGLKHWLDLAERLIALAAEWEVATWDTEQCRLVAAAGLGGFEPGKPRRHTSAKDVIPALYEAYPLWENVLLSAVLNDARYPEDHLAVATMLTVGVRPDEFERDKQTPEPIVVTLVRPGVLQFQIVGSKTGAQGKNSQPVRTVQVRIKSPETVYLNEQLAQAKDGRLVVSVKSKVNFCRRLERISGALFPPLRVVATLIRHVRMADAKFHLDRENVAFAFGHASDATATTWYFSWSKRPRGWRNPILETRGENEVRHRYRSHLDIGAGQAGQKAGERGKWAPKPKPPMAG